MLGYACINEELKAQGITTNRGMRKKTFDQKGIDYAAELALKNCQDLLKILQWNNERNIKFFRMSSNLFPWFSEYNMSDLPHYEEFVDILGRIGLFVNENKIRLTFHPDHFNKLGSPKDNVVQNTINDLNMHGIIMDYMGLQYTPYNKINIHVGATYGNKIATAMRFCNNFHLLHNNVKCRLTVENDDKASLFSVRDLFDLIYLEIGIPIVFDYHHHQFCTGGLTQAEAFELAYNTWPPHIPPVVHYSESRREEHSDQKIRAQAHSDFVRNLVDIYGSDAYIMFEAKAKEQALLRYRQEVDPFYVSYHELRENWFDRV